MIALRKPTDADITRFLNQQSQCGFNYLDVGATRRELPARYDHHQVEVILGQGRSVYVKAESALKAWKQFDVGWVSALPADTPICEGENIAIRASLFGMWSLAACRIIEVIDHKDTSEMKFGFAFGTLPAHPEQGEERFEIRCDASGIVTYRITAFFRPNYLSAKIAWPYLRRLFNLFRQQSADRLQVHCNS